MNIELECIFYKALKTMMETTVCFFFLIKKLFKAKIIQNFVIECVVKQQSI